VVRCCRRRREVRVVEAAAVLRLGIDGVVAGATEPEVVRLEVAGGLVEAVPVQHVVCEVVQVEQVLHRDRAVGGRRGRLLEVGDREEVSVADGRSAAVGRVVGVRVEVGPRVVAGDAERVLRGATEPALRRFGGRATVHDGLTALARILDEHVVAVVVGTELGRDDLALTVDQRVIELVALLRPGLGAPSRTCRRYATRSTLIAIQIAAAREPSPCPRPWSAWDCERRSCVGECGRECLALARRRRRDRNAGRRDL
jgi:hypothetical protein